MTSPASWGNHLTAPERETIVNFDDGGAVAYIYSAQRPVITRLRKHPEAVLIEEGTFGTSAWARFTIPADLISFRQPRKPRELSDEQRQAFADRMARSRNARPAERPQDDE